jgi:hypothetical protein
MAKVPLGDAASQLLKLLIALRKPNVQTAMMVYGLTQQDIQEGWELLRRLSAEKLDKVLALESGHAESLKKLDAWENLWFPIAGAVLERHAPEVHAEVFRNLGQASGAEVILTVGTFLRRLEEQRATEAGAQALAKLATRGLDARAIEQAQALLDDLQGVAAGSVLPAPTPNDGDEDGDEDPLGEGEGDEALAQQLHAYHKEWATIARKAIKDRRILRGMGLVTTTKKRPDPA